MGLNPPRLPREVLLLRERNLLARFAALVLRDWPEATLDGGDLQQLAVRCELLAAVTATEPCSEHCACADYGSGEWPVTCYRPTALLQHARTLEASGG